MLAEKRVERESQGQTQWHFIFYHFHNLSVSAAKKTSKTISALYLL